MDNTYSTVETPDRKRGKHLKFEDRCSIRVCRKLGLSLRKIADVVNCSASTVMYELKRDTGERKGNQGECKGNQGRRPEYSAKRGQKAYEENRSKCHKKSKVTAGSVRKMNVTTGSFAGMCRKVVSSRNTLMN